MLPGSVPRRHPPTIRQGAFDTERTCYLPETMPTTRNSPRKTAPKVRDGQVQKKNRWEKSVDADDTLLTELGISFDTRAPGPGQKHVVTELDVRRFIRCIPDWNTHAEGLRAIVLAPLDDAMGCYDHRGIIYLSTWDQDLFWSCDAEFFEEHRTTLLRLGVPHDQVVDDAIPLYFDERSARAFQLVHIFLHELGHHRDRMTQQGRSGRGEEFAETWAVRMEEQVWPRYKEFFGVPGKIRISASHARNRARLSIPAENA